MEVPPVLDSENKQNVVENPPVLVSENKQDVENPPVLDSENEQDVVENHLIKLTKRLINDINIQFAYIFEDKDVQNDSKTLLIIHIELHAEINSIIFKIKGALERISERDVIGKTLKLILKDIESIQYLTINPVVTFNTKKLWDLICEIMGIIRRNFILIVDLTEMKELLKGDITIRREYIAILNDILLILEKTRLHCPNVNIDKERITINLAKTQSIQQIKFSKEYQTTFFFESVRVANESMQNIIHEFHRSLYSYNNSTKKLLLDLADKLHEKLVDFEVHLAKVIKSADNEILYKSIARELSKLFEIWNITMQWIIDGCKDSNLKYEADALGKEEVVTPQSGTVQSSKDSNLKYKADTVQKEEIEEVVIPEIETVDGSKDSTLKFEADTVEKKEIEEVIPESETVDGSKDSTLKCEADTVEKEEIEEVVIPESETVNGSKDSTLKCDADTVEKEKIEEVVTSERKNEILATMLHQNMIIAEEFVKSLKAKIHEAKKISQENESKEETKSKCESGDVGNLFDDYGSFSPQELQRCFTSNYILLSRRFIREINVLFGN